MAKVMQQFDKMLQQVNPFVESYKWTHQITHVNPMMRVYGRPTYGKSGLRQETV
jgi:hypothetical protein